jgi:hypothetical protein
VLRYKPPAVGVPEITPVLAFRFNPGGRRPPATVQLNGAVPPDACKVVDGYVTFGCPIGREVVEIVIGGLIVMLSEAGGELVLLLSVSVRLNE